MTSPESTHTKDAAKAAPKSATIEAPKDSVKVKKTKLVRDSFTIPKDEFDVLAVIKHRAQALGHSVKKSEVIRAGLRLLNSLNDADLLTALKAVPSIKTGRPKNEDTVLAPKPTKPAKAPHATKAKTVAKMPVKAKTPVKTKATSKAKVTKAAPGKAQP